MAELTEKQTRQKLSSLKRGQVFRLFTGGKIYKVEETGGAMVKTSVNGINTFTAAGRQVIKLY